MFFNTHICPSIGKVGLIEWNDAHYGGRGNYAANAGWAGADSGLWMNDIGGIKRAAMAADIPRIQLALFSTRRMVGRFTLPCPVSARS